MPVTEILQIVILGFAAIGVIATVRWLRGLMRLVGGRSKSPVKPQRPATSNTRKAGYVIDGSNVMYWAGDGPDLGSVTAVVQRMKATGKEFHVFFDASVGYKLFDRHASAAEMAQALHVHADQVTVVPGGTDADVFILKYASRHRDTIVSNDQFKDNATLAKGLPRMRGVVSGGRAVFDG